jgi:hypothetical protein
MSEKYYSFLLRLWRSDSQEHPTWRVMLEDPHTRDVIGFDSLDALINHLQNLAGGTADPNNQDQIAGGS